MKRWLAAAAVVSFCLVALDRSNETQAWPVFDGLFAVAGGDYHKVEPGAGSWTTLDPATGSLNLKNFGLFMIHKEGGGTNQAFQVSEDEGQSWSATVKPIDDTDYKPVDADLCTGGFLWMAWQESADARTRIYYSDDLGASFVLSKQQSLGGIGGTSAHSDGSVTCHATDSNRIATVVQRGSSARVLVTTNGGTDWTVNSAGSLANAYRMVWSGDRLVLIYDTGSSVRILVSDTDGSSWTQTASFSQGGSNRSSNVDVIRTAVPDLLFAYAEDPGTTRYLLRSDANGDLDSWENVGAFPDLGTGAPNAIAYDAYFDELYLSWGNSGKTAVLPKASLVDWTAVEAADWTALPTIGSSIERRALTVIQHDQRIFDPFALPANSWTKDPISISNGDFVHQHTDIVVPGKGVPLAFSRTYHSGSSLDRSLGVGWTQSYDFYLVFNGSDVDVFYPNGHAVHFIESAGTYTPREGVFDTLVKNGDGTYTYTTVSATSYEFSSADKLTSLADRNGNTTTLAYDGSGFLESVTDPGGRSLDFTVDAGGRITQVDGPLGRSVIFTYDASGDLDTVQDVKGGTTDYDYDSHRMTSLTDSNGHVAVDNIYDAAGRAGRAGRRLG